jgi:hypothetical protein
MVPEDKFEILNAAARRAACKFNKDPEMREECYEYVLYHAALKISEEHNANYMRMRCDSLARNWYDDEYNRHAKRAEYGIDLDALPFTRTANNRHMTPEEQIIYREEIEGIYRLFAELGLTDFEMKVITTRAEGFITARQIADVESVNFSRVVKAAGRARKKLVLVLRETAIAKGYNPNGQFAPRLGHSRENKSRNKCADYYYPKRERKNKTAAGAQAG